MKKKPCPELPEWCSPSQRETKHSATSESVTILPFPERGEKSRKGGDVALWPICSPYVWLQPLSFNPAHVFIFNGIWIFFHTSIYLAFILRGFIRVYSMSVYSLPGHPFTAQVIDRLLCETRLNYDLKHNLKPPWQMSNASHIITTVQTIIRALVKIAIRRFYSASRWQTKPKLALHFIPAGLVQWYMLSIWQSALWLKHPCLSENFSMMMSICHYKGLVVRS